MGGNTTVEAAEFRDNQHPTASALGFSGTEWLFIGHLHISRMFSGVDLRWTSELISDPVLYTKFFRANMLGLGPELRAYGSAVLPLSPIMSHVHMRT